MIKRSWMNAWLMPFRPYPHCEPHPYVTRDFASRGADGRAVNPAVAKCGSRTGRSRVAWIDILPRNRAGANLFSQHWSMAA